MAEVDGDAVARLLVAYAVLEGFEGREGGARVTPKEESFEDGGYFVVRGLVFEDESSWIGGLSFVNSDFMVLMATY